MARHSATENQVNAKLADRPLGARSKALRAEREGLAQKRATNVEHILTMSQPEKATGTEKLVAICEPAKVSEPVKGSSFSKSWGSRVASVPMSHKALAAGCAVLMAGSVYGVFAENSIQPAFAQPDNNTGTAVATSDKEGEQVSLTVVFDGHSKKITTRATTLGDALRSAGITVAGDDEVSQGLATRPVDGSTVRITRVTYTTVTQDDVDVAQSQEVQDANLPKGKKQVEKQAKNGVVANTYRIRMENGKEVSRTITFAVQKQERVDGVVKVGTKEGVSGADGIPAGGPAVPAGSAQEIASGMLSSYGWSQNEFSCLVNLWNRESGWNYQSQNRSSGAYGIPQALPGSKMASAGADWRTNPATQIRWGLGYIKGRYGSPCGAWGAFQSKGWY
ncbi:G5 domain-containing protein [Actinotignum urinale]|uniref:aggregation-promoting factor C-terminal-like domain-containing protein n=1 Tax=Actinotignum urinale TaxID=190146 RepID=UPI00280BC66F|nr:G5 domain-containing protein [Actinotignum urinale]